jgi:hypothetical protein
LNLRGVMPSGRIRRSPRVGTWTLGRAGLPEAAERTPLRTAIAADLSPAVPIAPKLLSGCGGISHSRKRHCRLLHEFTFRPVGIANPCVFDKPLMPRPAVWTTSAAEKYRGG